ncbi:discoidin domain-containing protein [Caldimonas brevitalea]|uniref:F5/8 type C domain-containing protein n=1 Tax=Caldimonas brevitalea TaxID=413882 RepID=A0A0G3BLQ9_9BURK|nr:discoidin domain-containing protein [Caldimonas brevitalea]AKJ27495.1 hypothetical protein AAW51_0804 [Caldimonas brevitalea]
MDSKTYLNRVRAAAWLRGTTIATAIGLAACGGGGGDPPPALATQEMTGALEGADRARPLAAVITPPTDALVGALTPTADAAKVGMWSKLTPWPLLAAHANLLPNGRLLTFGTAPPDTWHPKVLHFDVWTPAQGLTEAAHRTVANPTKVDSFCSASTLGADGLLLVLGGNADSAVYKTTQWDPDRNLYLARAAQPRQPRYYATVLRLPDSRVLAVGGSNKKPAPATLYGDMPEVFTPAEGWRPLPGAKSAELFGEADARWWYPRAYVAPDFGVVGVSNDRLWKLDPKGDGSIVPIGVTGHRLGVSGMSVMYRPGKLLLAGGGQLNNGDGIWAVKQATSVDFNASPPTVTALKPMAHGRNWGTAVVLPTGDVLVTGGAAQGNLDTGAVLATEVWSPTTGTWSTWAPAGQKRLYHSLAALLPNGTVLSAGGGAPGPVYAQDAQVFFPPYLFKQLANGTSAWASRPVIVQTAPYFGHGSGADSVVTLGDTRSIKSVALVTVAAVTHSHSADLRYVPVAFTQSADKLTLKLSQFNPQQLPPGHYQLHVVDSAGVPSSAAVIEVRKDVRNIAALGTATQSSDRGIASAAAAAIDGKASTFTHTAFEQANPWWKLTFPSTRRIASINLFNRPGPCTSTNDCRTRLRDITVSVLDAAGQPVWTSQLLNPENQLASPDRLNVDIMQLHGSAVEGRSVLVRRTSDPDLSGSGGGGGTPEGNVLSLVEVQVEEGPVNLALRKAATQSSTAASSFASRAVDGNPSGFWHDATVTHTNSTAQPWWQLDLGSVQALRQVRVWNRVDCCAERLSNFYLLVSQTPFTSNNLEQERLRAGVTALPFASVPGGRVLDVDLPAGLTGRYLRVWLGGTEVLSLAEVEVFGP